MATSIEKPGEESAVESLLAIMRFSKAKAHITSPCNSLSIISVMAPPSYKVLRSSSSLCAEERRIRYWWTQVVLSPLVFHVICVYCPLNSLIFILGPPHVIYCLFMIKTLKWPVYWDSNELENFSILSLYNWVWIFKKFSVSIRDHAETAKRLMLSHEHEFPMSHIILCTFVCMYGR